MKEIARSLNLFKDILMPVSSIATSCISSLLMKSQQLLAEKQSVIDLQAHQMKELHHTIEQLNQKQDKMIE